MVGWGEPSFWEGKRAGCEAFQAATRQGMKHASKRGALTALPSRTAFVNKARQSPAAFSCGRWSIAAGWIYRRYIKVKEVITMKWLIWSHAHNGYWRDSGLGYTGSRQEAGQFETDEAVMICQEANYSRGDTQPPDETLLPADRDEAPAWLKRWSLVP